MTSNAIFYSKPVCGLGEAPGQSVGQSTLSFSRTETVVMYVFFLCRNQTSEFLIIIMTGRQRSRYICACICIEACHWQKLSCTFTVCSTPFPRMRQLAVAVTCIAYLIGIGNGQNFTRTYTHVLAVLYYIGI